MGAGMTNKILGDLNVEMALLHNGVDATEEMGTAVIAVTAQEDMDEVQGNLISEPAQP